MYIVFRTIGISSKNTDQYVIRNTEKKAIEQYKEWINDDSTYTASFGPIKKSHFWKVDHHLIKKNYKHFAIVRVYENNGNEVFDYSVVESNKEADRKYEKLTANDDTLFCGIAPISLSTDFF